MVFDAFLGLVTALLNAIFSALPQWTLTPDTGPISTLFFNLTVYNSILPVTEMFFCISLSGSVFVSITALKWGKGLYNAVRGSGA